MINKTSIQDQASDEPGSKQHAFSGSRYFCDGNSEVEHWWFGDAAGPFPGSSALFVGAGISIPSPTCLPNGTDLTQALIRHLLDENAASELLSVFAECAPVLGRSLPRLEHVLEKTCNPIDYEGFSRPGNPRDLLALFRDRTPNANHYLIARYILEHKGWCITTNFDDCIERAGAFRIPVHVMDADGKRIRILHSEHGTDWGLVKLHGTIEEGVEELWATLADLQFGLPEAMCTRLDEVMQQVDAFIVAGYSGTDYFDINHWIRDRTNARRDKGKPKLIWIFHAQERVARPALKDTIEPFASWTSAFSGTKYPMGPTTEILSCLLGIEADIENTLQQTAPPLDQVLSSLYQPSTAEMHLNGARLAAAVGLGQRAEEELRMLRHLLDDDKAAESIEPDIYFARGMTNEAVMSRAYLNRAGAGRGMVAHTHMLRQQGRPLAVITHFLFSKIKKHENPAYADAAIDALTCGLDIVQGLQRLALFRTSTARRTMEVMVNALYRYASRYRHNLPIDLQGRLQTQGLRHSALLGDEDDDASLGRLWRLVHEQYSPPDLYLDSGPVIPGFFLIEKSTAREQDRLSDLVRINIELADVLLVALRRRWPRGIVDVDREFKRNSRNSTHADFEIGKICTTVLFELLFDSNRIATALREHGLQVSIATCWQKADRLLGGVSYWKQQRMYLSSRRRLNGVATPRGSGASTATTPPDASRDAFPPD